MTLTPGAQRNLFGIFCFVLLIVYGIAWFAPAPGLPTEDGICLVAARALAAGHGYVADNLPTPITETRVPPLFPSLLALFTLVSQSTLWLRLLPLISTAGWLLLTGRLLIRIGASTNGARVIAALTAASPAVISAGTSLVPEALFGCWVAATFLALLEDRAPLAGVCAGLATLTLGSGVALIAAGILTFAARQRFRNAIVFTVVAMAIAAPWFAWSLAHEQHEKTLSASNIFMGLHASEKLVVLGRNLVLLLESPWAVMTGRFSLYAGMTAALLIIWSLIRRRQLAPDLFLGLYCIVLACRVSPPQHMVIPLLPLVLWLLWRAFGDMRNKEALAACVLVISLGPLGADFGALRNALRFGQFTASEQQPNDAKQMERLFRYLRGSTPDTVVVALEDAAFYLHTGSKSTSGFTADNYTRYYAPKGSIVTPDALGNALVASGAGYLALAPDRNLPESPSYRRSVDALQRGGVLEPVEVPGLEQDYRLLRIAGLRSGAD